MATRAITVRTLVRRGAVMFTQAGLVFGHGIASARDEATVLTLHALKLAHGDLPLQRRVGAAAAARVLALFDQRMRERKPAAYYTNEAWLGPYRFFVDERVIVPRSFIADVLFDEALPYLPAAGAVRHALDLCTGSGCLAVLLAKRYRTARVDAADISPEALQVAHLNFRRFRLGNRVKPLISNYFSELRERRYELIVSNPPYVRSAVMRTLPREYRSEPALALAAGRDGLDALRVILGEAAQHLNPGGVLIVECGHARARVERVWPRLPFVWPETAGGDDCVFILTREDLVRAFAPAPAERLVAATR